MKSTFNILFYVNKSLPSLLIRKQTNIFVWHSTENCVLGYTLQRKLFAVCQAKGNKKKQLLWHLFIKNSKKRTFFFVG